MSRPGVATVARGQQNQRPGFPARRYAAVASWLFHQCICCPSYALPSATHSKPDRSRAVLHLDRTDVGWPAFISLRLRGNGGWCGIIRADWLALASADIAN